MCCLFICVFGPCSVFFRLNQHFREFIGYFWVKTRFLFKFLLEKINTRIGTSLIENNKQIIGRNVTFNEATVLNRAKLVEIFDSEADGGCKADDQRMTEEVVEVPLDHSTDMDSTGDSEENINSANSDGIGNNEKQELRRSNRTKQQPQRFGQTESDAHFALSAQHYVNCDPESIDDAKQRDDWPNWKEAIDSEYDSLMKNNTWILCDLPKERKAITGKWVFKLKHKSNGDIDKYKARFVARGCSQKQGFDYAETYAPVAKLTTTNFIGYRGSIQHAHSSNGCERSILEWQSGRRDLHQTTRRRQGMQATEGDLWFETSISYVERKIQRIYHSNWFQTMCIRLLYVRENCQWGSMLHTIIR